MIILLQWYYYKLILSLSLLLITMLYVGKTNPDLWRARRVQPEHLLVAFEGFRVLPAVELHCGFAEDGRRPRYYQPDDVDAVIMQLDLSTWVYAGSCAIGSGSCC